MSLLLPAFLAAAALIALPIVLHLLRRQPRDRVPFPTLRFLGPNALRDTRRQQIMRWLTLLARCALILLVAFAFSRPYWPRSNDNNNKRAVIVAVDNSFSMQATGRRQSVDAWLDEKLSSLRPGDRLGVLQLQPMPTWIAPLSENIDTARAALKTREDGYETSHYAAGLALAAAVLDETPAAQRQILLAGDEQRLAWTDVDLEHALPPGVELLTAPPAPPPGTQAAISNFHASREPNGKLLLEATVRLYLPAKLQRTVTFYAGDQALGKQTIDLAAGESHVVKAEFPLPAGNGDLALRATIDDDDLGADNIAYTVLPPASTRQVMLAAPTGNEMDFLSHALAAVHGGDLPTLLVNPLPVTAWPLNAVAVLRGSAPFRGNNAAALDAFLETGGSAWVLCDGSPEQIAWLARHGVKITPAKPAEGGAALHLRDFDVDHPLFAPFAGRSLAPLLDAEFLVGWSIASEDADPLARWPDRTVAVAEVHLRMGRLLVTGFDDRRTTANWPLQTAFVPFAHHAIVWLGDSAPTLPVTGRVGLRLTLPGPGQWQSLNSPRVTPSHDVSGAVISSAPGIYEYRVNGAARLFAINVDPEESDLSSWPIATDFAKLNSTKSRAPGGDATTPLAALSDDHNTQIWWWLMAAALLMLGFELSIANRTIP